MLEIDPIKGVSPDIKELKGLSPANFCASKTIKAIDLLTDVITEESEPGEASELQRALEEILEKFSSLEREAPLEYQHLKELRLRLQIASFVMIKDSEVDELLSQDLIFILKHGINLRGLLYMRFVAHEDGLSKSAMRKRYVQLIRDNSERLGSKKIEIKIEAGLQEPIIKNWLRDYDQYFDDFVLRSGFEQAAYISQSPNVKSLNGEEREVLIQLLQVYDFLRFPAAQDGVGIPGITLHATNQPLKTENRLLLKPINITQGYDIEENTKLAIEKERQKLKNNFSDNFLKARDLLFSYLFPVSPTASRPEKAKVIAVLYYLAEKAKLPVLLSEDRRFKEKFVAFLKKGNRADDISNLDMNSQDPLVVSHFLKYLLEEKMAMAEDEAAKYAAKLGNLMRKAGQPEYFGMAYYDMSEKKFKWKS